MKLSWKLFFVTTPIFILFLTIFGSWLIQDNFQSSLDREVQRCMVENKMFQNSYELTRNSLTEEQQEQVATDRLVQSFYGKQGQNTGEARIYGADGAVLYEGNEFRLKHGLLEQLNERKDEGLNVGYELIRNGYQTYMVVMSRTSFGDFIETTKDITEIFQERSAMYSRYQVGVLAMAFLSGGLILVVLFLVMRDMQKLSRATRQFARGKYDVQVAIRSKDEIGMLATDFNWMAGTMNQQMEKLQNEVKRQEEFTAAFAHELKTPLTSIIGYADTIRQMELSPEETDMCADYIFHQGKRLQSLSYKLLDMTMAEKKEITQREIFVPEFLAEIEKTVRVALKEKHLRLLVQAEEGIVYGDRDLLSSLFINLIDNARKVSGEGKIIFLVGQVVPGGYTISVEDQGGGLPPEEVSRITEAFYMVDKSRSRKEGGAGLGLALCQKIIELHQGSWQFDNQPGHGLKVTVRLGIPEGVSRERRGKGRK